MKDYNDLNKIFASSGVSRPPWQLINEALSIAIPVMIKASVAPSNLDDLMRMSRALNGGELGMFYHNVDEFINSIGHEIDSDQYDAIEKGNPLISQLAKVWLEQWKSIHNHNRPNQFRHHPRDHRT